MRRVEALDASREEEAQAVFPRRGVLKEERSNRPSRSNGSRHEKISYDRIVSHLHGEATAGVPRGGNEEPRGPVGLETDLVVDDEVRLHAGRAWAPPKDREDGPSQARAGPKRGIQSRAQRRRGISMARDGRRRRAADPRKTAGVVNVGVRDDDEGDVRAVEAEMAEVTAQRLMLPGHPRIHENRSGAANEIGARPAQRKTHNRLAVVKRLPSRVHSLDSPQRPRSCQVSAGAPLRDDEAGRDCVRVPS